ncbi:MAG: HAD family phosphatase [Betaproteobacteria bacterium]|nr:HAD family phosphatase [Betaproteobacteria bacterium]
MRFQALLFDCDGVLVDSEAITCGVLRDMLEEKGWRLTLAQCMGHFVGHTVRNRADLVRQHTGWDLTEEWLQSFYARRNAALAQDIRAIEGVLDLLGHAQHLYGARMAVASGADRYKVEMMLTQVGLLDFFSGRVFSGHEMPRSKPAPDVYLAAAAHLQADPAACLVIEDTPTGIAAGLAAGATVWAYCPQGASEQALLQAGAHRVFARMDQLQQALV